MAQFYFFSENNVSAFSLSRGDVKGLSDVYLYTVLEPAPFVGVSYNRKCPNVFIYLFEECLFASLGLIMSSLVSPVIHATLIVSRTLRSCKNVERARARNSSWRVSFAMGIPLLYGRFTLLALTLCMENEHGMNSGMLSKA